MTFWKPHRGGFTSGFIWLFYWERLLSIMKPGIGSVRKQYLSWDICFLFYITIYRNCLRLEGRSSKTKEKGRNTHTHTYIQTHACTQNFMSVPKFCLQDRAFKHYHMRKRHCVCVCAYATICITVASVLGHMCVFVFMLTYLSVSERKRKWE